MDEKITELRGSVDVLRDEISTLADADELDEAGEARFDEAVTEYEAASDELTKLEERAAKIEKIRTAPVREPGVPTVMVRTDRNVFDASELRGMPVQARKAELRSRAVAVIEAESARTGFMSDEQRETATRHAERSSGIAEHILAVGSDDYLEKFEHVLASPNSASARLALEQAEGAEFRAAMSNTDANGGLLSVPLALDPTIILTNNGAVNPFRAISDVRTISGTDTWRGITSAGVNAEWLGEGSEAADASPTFTNTDIVAHKAAAYAFGSVEFEADSGIAAQVAGLIADAKDRLEATAHATGSGSSQPVGIVTALALTTASRVAGSSGAAGAADLVAADIFALDNDLGPRFRQNASFVGNKTTWNAVRRLANVNAGNNPASFWVDFGGGLPSKLIGYNVYEASAMDSTVVSGSNDDVIILGDFKNYVIVDRVGLSLAYNPLVVGSNQRPTGQVGWFAFWRTGADSVNDAAFRELRL